MLRRLFAGVLLATSVTATSVAFAQTGTPPQNSSSAMDKPGSSGSTPSVSVELVPGANSLTEAEARRRLEKKGYSNVHALKMDQNGIWRGYARKNAKEVEVGLDFEGHIADYPL
jgi:putative membrane protein